MFSESLCLSGLFISSTDVYIIIDVSYWLIKEEKKKNLVQNYDELFGVMQRVSIWKNKNICIGSE